MNSERNDDLTTAYMAGYERGRDSALSWHKNEPPKDGSIKHISVRDEHGMVATFMWRDDLDDYSWAGITLEQFSAGIKIWWAVIPPIPWGEKEK